MSKILIITLLLLFCSFPLYAETNYCHDQESWDQWNKVIKRSPNDIPLQILHALRIGVCVKVEQNSITFEEATDLFNEMYFDLFNQKGKDEKAEKDKQM